MTTSPRRGSSSAAPIRTNDKPSHGPPADARSPLAEVTRLVNRVAIQTFLTAFAFVAGLVALPRVLEGASVTGRLLAALPMAAALGLVTWGLRLRVELRRARDRASSQHAGGAKGTSPLLP